MIGNKNDPRLTKSEVKNAELFINDYWQKLIRKTPNDTATLVGLPNEYVVPSVGTNGFMFEEQYYWDSYFTSLGIDDENLVTGMLDNLIFLFEKFGLIPNANRYYFTSRSQPPILTTYIFHVYDKYDKSKEWLETKMAVAKREYQEVWMSDKHPQNHLVHQGLSRYYDINYLHDLAEAESGWDMTPRFKRQCLDYLPIDLNSMLYKYEKDFSRLADILNNPQEVELWEQTAETRQKTVTELMWHKRNKCFFDYNYTTGDRSSIWSLAAYYSLWSGLATEDQAKKLVKNLEKFEKKGGLSTTAGLFMYANLFGSTKTQWSYPNGWAPLHSIVIDGLEKYGYHEEANRIAKKWLITCNNWFKSNGEFQEKYNVVSPLLNPVEGVYPSQKGFGWTNGVFIDLSKKYL